MSKNNDCSTCNNYVYNEEYDEYECHVNMDEDDYYRLMNNRYESCRYYQSNDEYSIVRKQM